MPNLKFELFELICDELRVRPDRIITESILSVDQLEELRDLYSASDDQTAIERALTDMEGHFKSRGARLPFGHDRGSSRFWRTDADFIKFVSNARSIRGSGNPSAKQFEKETWIRLQQRLTGTLHHVGWERKKKKKRKEFVSHLMELGFDSDVLEPADKDGGFDIIWLPPLGGVPIRPIISLQCKNSSFDKDDAFTSTGQAGRSITRHSHMRASGTYILGVIFNDYIDQSFEGKSKGWSFVPLGLTDLATLKPKLQSLSLS
jgi:hypothetical protein